jgi:hypothetical protein
LLSIPSFSSFERSSTPFQVLSVPSPLLFVSDRVGDIEIAYFRRWRYFVDFAQSVLKDVDEEGRWLKQNKLQHLIPWSIPSWTLWESSQESDDHHVLVYLKDEKLTVIWQLGIHSDLFESIKSCSEGSNWTWPTVVSFPDIPSRLTSFRWESGNLARRRATRMTEQVDAPIDPQMSAQAAEAVIADAALNAQSESHDATGKRKREDGEEEAPSTTRAQFKRQGIPQQPPTGAFMPVNVGVAPTAQMQSTNQFAQMQQGPNGVDVLSMHPGIPVGVGQQAVFDPNLGRQQPGNDQIDPAFNLQAHNPQAQQVQQQPPPPPVQSPQPAPKPPVGSEEWHRVRRDNHKEGVFPHHVIRVWIY